MKISKFILFFITLFILQKTNAFENLVYTWGPTHVEETEITKKDVIKQAKKIQILSSEAYHIDETGLVYGAIDPQMLQITRQAHIKFMPLIGNKNFDRKLVHQFLTDENAIKKAATTILELCKKNQFYGMQIDFEGMSYQDKQAFTHFYQIISNQLHQNGFKVSIAIIPTLTAHFSETAYLTKRYENWSGVYDYKQLAQLSDFVTLMAYDQHGGITTPGPTAGNAWNEAIIRYALQFMPAEKISLGIPLHSAHWFTGNEVSNPIIHPVSVTLTYPQVEKIIAEKKLKLKWDNLDKDHYAIYVNHYLYEYLYLEDVASFKAKLMLVKKYHLRGISDWCLGEEDPKIWRVLG